MYNKKVLETRVSKHTLSICNKSASFETIIRSNTQKLHLLIYKKMVNYFRIMSTESLVL